jgi:hypothetical protein
MVPIDGRVSPVPAFGSRIGVLLWGVGALGAAVARLMARDPRFRIVAAVDWDDRLAGRSLAGAVDALNPDDPVIYPDVATAFRGARAPVDVVLHMTESRPERILPQLEAAIERGANVVTAAESMYYPRLRFPEVAERLDAAARAGAVTVTGTGVNPGFVFDALTLAAAAGTTNIRGVRMKRSVIVNESGPGDTEHEGYGLSPERFAESLADGSIVGHMGFPEQIAVLAERLNLEVDRIEEAWLPSATDHVVRVASGDLSVGTVTSLTQECRGWLREREVITASLTMHTEPGIVEPRDEIVIEGAFDLRLSISPGYPSIAGAAAVMINTIPLVLQAGAGLACVVDLPFGFRRYTAFRYEVAGESIGHLRRAWTVARIPTSRSASRR